MNELIRVKNSSYSRYEELLLRRDKLKKDAFLYGQAYIKEFGDKIIKVFEKKISCIKKKKEISYCQAILNHDGKLNQNELDKYIKKELKEYQKQLKQMIKENNNAKNSKELNQIDLLEIRKIYKQLVKKVHPDINPKTKDSKELIDLWNRIVIAYECNDIKELRELEVLVNKTLESLGIESIEIEIPDIQEKIVELENEIRNIINKDPYLYKYILDDKDAKKEQNDELDDEYNYYNEYEKELDELIIKIKSELGE